jgi:hypothetical protein
MTGYLATMGYFPERDLSAAVMLNTDDGAVIGMPLSQLALRLATIAADELDG